MLVLHFGSCLGCVEPVLIEWSVSCLGGARRKLNGSDIFRVLGASPGELEIGVLMLALKREQTSILSESKSKIRSA